MRCNNCGAPIEGSKCEYCGADNGIIIPFGGKQIKCYISEVTVHTYGYCGRDLDGVIHDNRVNKYEFKVVSV